MYLTIPGEPTRWLWSAYPIVEYDCSWGESMFVRNTAAKRLVRQYIKPALRRMWPWRHKNLNGIRVNYLYRLDGGGTSFGQDYIPYLRNRGMPRQARTFEWCAGPEEDAVVQGNGVGIGMESPTAAVAKP